MGRRERGEKERREGDHSESTIPHRKEGPGTNKLNGCLQKESQSLEVTGIKKERIHICKWKNDHAENRGDIIARERGQSSGLLYSVENNLSKKELVCW